VKPRLAVTAQDIAARVTIGEVGQGLARLIGDDLSTHAWPPWRQRRDSVGILVAQLLDDPNAPFRVDRDAVSGRAVLASRDGRRTCTLDPDSPLRALLTHSAAAIEPPPCEWLVAEAA